MTTPGHGRTLASLVHDDAPLAPRRAASVMVAVCRELERADAAGHPCTDVTAAAVRLAPDGSVRIGRSGSADGVSAGASVGRLLFELLVGRPPLGTEDAFEPHLQASLAPPVVAMVARSCAGSPGQWPSVAEWSVQLGALAGGQAPPLPPRRVMAIRRRRVAIAVALALLLAVSVVVVVLAPRWWDDATRDEAGLPAAQWIRAADVGTPEDQPLDSS